MPCGPRSAGGRVRRTLVAMDDARWQLALFAVASFGEDAEPAGALERIGEEFGRYEGLPPQLELLDDGRMARLLSPISYVAANDEAWPVPADTVVDGASIPRLFWTLIGGPFEGKYRNASIVHDCYCDTRERSSRGTHRMFYSAMRCSGVSPTKAKIMFYAVYRFGPRWPDGGLETMAAPIQPAQADPLTFVADAQSISLLDPSLEEIESLADARTHQEASKGLEAFESLDVERARRLVVTGGNGTVDDLEAVAREVANLPDFVLGRFENRAARIVACRGSVTDFETRLKGVTPRGWDGTGKTWDDVPGTYFDNRKSVVIATVDSGGSRMVPTKASRLHGSANLVVHESLHGYDRLGAHQVLADPRFLTARSADFPKLGSYERQLGQAGLEETFAETGARYVGESDALSSDWPHLFAYWCDGVSRFGSEAPMHEAPEAGAIGTAERLSDGTIELDLRAEDESGAIGHALLRIAPEDPHYEAVSAHVARTGGMESVDQGPVLFMPMEAK